jgi:hypothetical protein
MQSKSGQIALQHLKLITFTKTRFDPGLFYRAEDYMYSSTRNYAGLESVLEVSILTKKWKTYR